MDRVSSIFARFEPTNSSRFLTSNVIGHVQPRASVGGGGVFSDTETAKIPPLLAALPSITTMQIALDVSASPQQTPLEYIREPSLSERKNNVAVFMSRSASPVSHETRMPARPAPADEPVRSVAFSSRPTQPRPKRASRTVPSVKTIHICSGYPEAQTQAHSNQNAATARTVSHELSSLQAEANTVREGSRNHRGATSARDSDAGNAAQPAKFQRQTKRVACRC